MCRMPSLVTEAERKHVRRRARFQQHGDASCHQVFFPLQGKARKKIHAILTETSGGHAPSYATVVFLFVTQNEHLFRISKKHSSQQIKLVEDTHFILTRPVILILLF